MTQPAVIEHFGKYRLLKKIGQGGMAEVFLAQTDGAAANAPPVVVKRLHQELENDAEAVDLFLTEADVTMLLDHPNIIRVYDSGEIGNRYYMAMEYVHGKDLEQIRLRFQQKHRVMLPNVAVHIVSEMLKGLDYVHNAKTSSGRALGCVHRDITPSNIYISTQGIVKVGDFGVAKLVGVEAWTMAGSIKGKLGYLSPEQIAGQPPDQSIDLWACAVILYELLAGDRVFAGDNELDVMLRIKAAKVPKIRKINDAIPRRLQKILQRALHKRPRARFPSAAAFLGELQSYREKEGEPFSNDALVQYLRTTLT